MDSAAQVAFVLVNVTGVTDNIQNEDIAIVSSLLDRVANSTDIEEQDVSCMMSHNTYVKFSTYLCY